MAGVMEEIAERVRQDTVLQNTINMAKKMLAESDLSLEEIAEYCELPLEKIQELAAEKVVSD